MSRSEACSPPGASIAAREPRRRPAGAVRQVITVEEFFGLQFPLLDVVGLQCRRPNLEGPGRFRCSGS
jgi:hypothetical protein